MKFVTHGLAILLLLSGCAKEPSEVVDNLTLPDLVNYPQSKMTLAAAEIDANFCPILGELAVDYGVARDQIRVALGKKVDIMR